MNALEVFRKYTKLAMLAIKAYIGKEQNKFKKKVTLLTWQVLIEGYLTSLLFCFWTKMI